jgi:hypothetical protein
MEDVDSPQQLLKVALTGQYPLLYNSYMQSRIKLETVMIMNQFLNFFTVEAKRVDDDLISPNLFKNA